MTAEAGLPGGRGRGRHDIIIRGGTVIDGSGAPAFRADVGIRGGRISAIGDLAGDESGHEIDARQRAVAPGFIDSHCHSDLSLLARPAAHSKTRQGVTTEIVGNCGWSAFPLDPATVELYRRTSKPIFGDPAVAWDWHGLGGYFRKLEQQGTGVNVATLIGHGALRAAVMGLDDRPASAREIDRMKELAREAMEEGAFGFSTGLCYVPGIYAGTQELVQITSVVARFGGLYATHLRDQVDGLLESVEEALEIGTASQIPVLISHHKTCGRRNFGKSRISLGMLDAAQAAGLPTYSDTYPYIAGSSTMAMFLPPWVLEGGVDAMIGRLAQRECRARIARDWIYNIDGWENRVSALGWENISLSHVGEGPNQDLIGLSVADAALKRGKAIVDFVADLMIEERGEVGQIMQNSCEADLATMLLHPRTMICSDGLDVGDKPHPRQYGTFPKVLGELVRDRGLLTLEAAVHKMSGYTATVFGLPEIGFVKAGYRADLVVFDPATIRANATFHDPRRYPDGIDWVLVGGKPAVAQGQPTGELNGIILRKPGAMRRDDSWTPAP